MPNKGLSHDPETWREATRLVHGGTLRSQFGETSEALFLTQGFVYDTAEAAEARFKGEEPGFVYSRYSNPTIAMFEERMCLLEGAEAARATASGMAAVTASLMGQLKAGDHLVAARALFGSCLYIVEELLPRFGVASTLVDGADLEQWRKAARPQTKVFFLETPTNPCLEIYDIEAIAKIAHENGATLVVDNVFASPVLQKPLQHGADCTVYSATKHIDGQGRCLGGVILASRDFIDKHIHNLLRQTGPALSPFNAWVLLKSLETLPLRVAQQTRNAEKIADALAGHPNIKRLIYPGRPDHPQAELVRRQMKAGGTLIALDSPWRQSRRLRLCQCTVDHQDFQQSGRRQEHPHPSGDDDASAADAGGTHRLRDYRRARASFGRSRRRRRPHRGPEPGACSHRSGSSRSGMNEDSTRS